MNQEQGNQIERWRFEKIRSGAVEALNDLASVMLHLETGNYLEEGQVYLRVARATSILADAINKGVEE